MRHSSPYPQQIDLYRKWQQDEGSHGLATQQIVEEDNNQQTDDEYEEYLQFKKFKKFQEFERTQQASLQGHSRNQVRAPGTGESSLWQQDANSQMKRLSQNKKYSD